MSTFHKLTVQKIVKETTNAVSVLFEVPAALKDAFSFVAGQYITIKKTIDEKEIRRAYSICSSPKSNELKVAIKAVEHGLFSVFATSKLKEGDVLEVAEPEGKFLLNPTANKNYIAFAAGSGITPVLSMVKAVLETEKSSTFTLIYGNKSTESTIFKNELETLLEKYNPQFNLHYVFSKTLSGDSIFGRIDKGNTNYFIKNKYKNTVFDAAFICGPEKMINTVSETLQENNFDKENILFELFTTSDEENNIKIPDGKSEITVLLDDEETTFTMNKTDDILAASLRNNLDAPYSCQGGVCSSCLCKVTEGKAIMTKNSILTDGEVEEGFVLACQAHPTTSKITIDFDDI
ncbi:1,2-phenylacetyl-CoA epoxidase, subunit E [Polaribacter huanghezhanensis]|uniref:ferredoxin--NADP reductase n=1 Tax=Polaribacter huanghezhanensis TaxID=1354726 RepID=UPI00264732CD|nr:ferredoxin--NADP reductase [Polaribacter huanghezhanensis]WKD85446.1 1,2-phenylacetyl-CoA epoxidase, subunit E [Polaribacter huanghezhanensis]